MPFKLFSFLAILLNYISSANAQYRYTPLKRVVSLEAFGVGPAAHLSAETPFCYRTSRFLSVQAGLGMYRQTESISYKANGVSLGSALTHCVMLNRRRSTCDPQPEYHRWETYFESGFSGSLFPSRFKITEDSPAGGVVFASQFLAGFRFHYIGHKEVYVFKVRYTPYLAPGFPQWAGLVIGMGAR